jgi:hypothetical protein
LTRHPTCWSKQRNRRLHKESRQHPRKRGKEREEGRTDEVLGLVERETASVVLATDVSEKGETRFGDGEVGLGSLVVNNPFAIIPVR